MVFHRDHLTNPPSGGAVSQDQREALALLLGNVSSFISPLAKQAPARPAGRRVTPRVGSGRVGTGRERRHRDGTLPPARLALNGSAGDPRRARRAEQQAVSATAHARTWGGMGGAQGEPSSRGATIATGPGRRAGPRREDGGPGDAAALSRAGSAAGPACAVAGEAVAAFLPH